MEIYGSSEMEYTEVQTAAPSLDGSMIFHIVNDILGFVLYMHQQIPSTLQDINAEFDTLHSEYKKLETVLAQTEVKSSFRRKQSSRMRDIKMGIKRLEKLMNTISNLQTALKLTMHEVPNIEGIILALGASPLRPHHVYKLRFLHGTAAPIVADDFTRIKATECLSRKAIRELISKGAGSSSYPGPSKLFLFVKAPSSFSQTLHFLPKRDFRYNQRQIVPFKLQFKCRTQNGNSAPAYHDSMWFQSRHVIKGLPLEKTPED